MKLKAAVGAAVVTGTLGLVAAACVPDDCHVHDGGAVGTAVCDGPTDNYRADITYRDVRDNQYKHAFGPTVRTGHASIAYVPDDALWAGSYSIVTNVDY